MRRRRDEGREKEGEIVRLREEKIDGEQYTAHARDNE